MQTTNAKCILTTTLTMYKVKAVLWSDVILLASCAYKLQCASENNRK